MRRQSKKSKAAYEVAMHATFDELGAQPLADGHEWAFMYTHSIDTHYGELVLHVSAANFCGVTVFGRFTDVERANAGRPSTGIYGDHNPYTGKWNLNCLSDGETPETAAAALRARLKTVQLQASK